MSDFPPRDYLAHLVDAIARQLPTDYAHLLTTGRFSEEAALLERLRRPEQVAKATAAMEPAEAERLADRLLARWERIGEVKLGPLIAIVCPHELWLSNRPRPLTLQLATLGVDEAFQAQWSGDVQPDMDGTSGQLMIEPPTGDTAAQVSLGVRVIGRSGGQRCVLTAQRSVQLRRIRLHYDQASQRIYLADQRDRAGAGVSVMAGDWTGRTAADGSCKLPDDQSPTSTLVFDSEAEEVIGRSTTDEQGKPAG